MTEEILLIEKTGHDTLAVPDYKVKKNPWAGWFSVLSFALPVILIAVVAYSFFTMIVWPTKDLWLKNISFSQVPSYGPNNSPKVLSGPSPFDALSLEAKAVYVYDELENRVLFAKNEEVQLPLASLTKIMTALAASEILPDYTTLTVSPEVLKGQSDSGLIPNERWRFQDLLDFTLVMSSNAGADAIAGAAGAVLMGRDQNGASADYQNGKTAFVDYLNRRARELRLHQTYFMNNTGLDQSADISGGYGSAKDVATLFTYAMENHPDIFTATRYPAVALESIDGKKHLAVNTDTIIQSIPGLVASKTGLTDLAGGNLAIVFDVAFTHRIVAVVMGSTEEGRFDDMKKLVGATFASFSYEGK